MGNYLVLLISILRYDTISVNVTSDLIYLLLHYRPPLNFYSYLSSNEISKFQDIQKRAIRWTNGRRFDHFSDEQLNEKEKRT